MTSHRNYWYTKSTNCSTRTPTARRNTSPSNPCAYHHRNN
uniref:Uncharacterized protein n=1 Tax=Anguilla anguilla TaxID=7936 RepID=A0A0E9XV67_ANGAN